MIDGDRVVIGEYWVEMSEPSGLASIRVGGAQVVGRKCVSAKTDLSSCPTPLLKRDFLSRVLS